MNSSSSSIFPDWAQLTETSVSTYSPTSRVLGSSAALGWEPKWGSQYVVAHGSCVLRRALGIGGGGVPGGGGGRSHHGKPWIKSGHGNGTAFHDSLDTGLGRRAGWAAGGGTVDWSHVPPEIKIPLGREMLVFIGVNLCVFLGRLKNSNVLLGAAAGESAGFYEKPGCRFREMR
eukprot:9503986-Pyramimonas_sp.AAC.1